MSSTPTQRIRLVFEDNQGLGRVSMDLTTFFELVVSLADRLERLEHDFASWETERSRRRAGRHASRTTHDERSRIG